MCINFFAEGFVLNNFGYFFFFTLLPFLGGTLIYVRARIVRTKDKDKDLEINVMKLAMKRGGKITVTEASVALKQTVSRIDQVVRKLQSDGAFEVQVSKEGVLIYKVNAASRSSKETAYSV